MEDDNNWHISMILLTCVHKLKIWKKDILKKYNTFLINLSKFEHEICKLY